MADNAEAVDKVKTELQTIRFIRVFRFADCRDKLMMLGASVMAVINGASMAFMMVILGWMADLFVNTQKLAIYLDIDIEPFMASYHLTPQEVFKIPITCLTLRRFYKYDNPDNISCADMPNIGKGILKEMTTFADYYCILGGVVFVSASCQAAFWMIAAERQGHKIKESYLRSITSQTIGRFDTDKAVKLSTQMGDDVRKIQDGIGQHVGTFIQELSTFFTGIAIGFVYGWELTLVILACASVLMVVAMVMRKVGNKIERRIKREKDLGEPLKERERTAYANAGAVAEEVLGSIRTVVAFGGQGKELGRYEGNLAKAERFGIKKGCVTGLRTGFISMALFVVFGVGFWYGGNLVRKGEYDVSNMFITYFSVLFGASALGNTRVPIEAMSTAKGAAYSIYSRIDLESPIDSSIKQGERPPSKVVVAATGTPDDLEAEHGIYHQLVLPGNDNAHLKLENLNFDNSQLMSKLSITKPSQFKMKINPSSKCVVAIQNGPSMVDIGIRTFKKDTVKPTKAPTPENMKIDLVTESYLFGIKRDTEEKPKAEVTVVTVVPEKEGDLKKLPPSPSPFRRVIRMNKPEWRFILVACVAATLNGGMCPAFGVRLSQLLGIFSDRDEEKQKERINHYSLFVVAIGGATCFMMAVQGYYFAKSGERLTKRLRLELFKAMLKQDMAWYDDHENSVGALTTRLATDAAMVQQMTGAKWSKCIEYIANLGTVLFIVFQTDWKLSLVIVVIVLCLGCAIYLNTKIMSKTIINNKNALDVAGDLAAKRLKKFRTNAAKEKKFFNTYMDTLNNPHRAALRGAFKMGLTYGAMKAILFICYTTCLFYGVHFVGKDEMIHDDVFLALTVIVIGAMRPLPSTFAPDMEEAKISATKILNFIDSKPSIDFVNNEGKYLDPSYTANVEFQSAEFCYPTRPKKKVLRELSFEVLPGQTLALVGSSDSGKSTALALIERFYDTDGGTVLVGQRDVKTLNIQWLRSQIGIVSQKPAMFDLSIAENIAYGDNSRTVAMDEIIDAAKTANIDTFIAGLPEGYKTNVGSKGTQLSESQKQRVAIARALVRNPRILLLDEAIRARDTEDERVVQDALNKARQGRTCIVIANRLPTLQNADNICVMSKGKVEESGNHTDFNMIYVWSPVVGSEKRKHAW